MESGEARIEALVGEELNIVSFVMDYLEFHFNGPVIRALTNPAVETAQGRWRFPEPGSRDALCSLIGQQVTGVEVRDALHAQLRFAGGQRLTIPLDPGSYRGAEAMHFQASPTAPLQVWN